MPWLACKSRRIHYELTGPEDGPACVLVNGLSQYVKVWMPFRDGLVARGFCVASYDMLGQGQSDKPRLFIEQSNQVEVLRDLIASLGPRPVFIGGISFGGVIALRYAIEHPGTIAGLVPMSSFAEMPPQLMRLGTALHTALILLQDLLFPMNFSNAWLEANTDLIRLATHRGWLINDLYALQSLMESFLNFEPLTPKLAAIHVPTMILSGEFDFLTPRPLQDSLRVHIPDSALVIIPRAYHASRLSAGERGMVLVLAASQDQARVVFSYAKAFLENSPVLRQEIADVTRSEIRLRNGITIAIHSNSFRTIRGRILCACIFDEVAMWRDESSAMPDIETYRSVLPALLTTKGMLVGISTGYRRVGLLYQKHRDHFGQDNADTLVVQGGTLQFNGTIDEADMQAQIAADPVAAVSEWQGGFRDDLSTFLADELIDAAIDPGRPLELPPQEGVVYVAFVDAASGASDRADAYTVAIGHRENGKFIVDVVRGVTGTYDPYAVTRQFAELLKQYGIRSVTGDNYGAKWVSQYWREAGVAYEKSPWPRSEIHLEVMALFARNVVCLPDHPRMIRELRLLERSTNSGSHDAVNHGRNGHDDFSNVACGVLRVLDARRVAEAEVPITAPGIYAGGRWISEPRVLKDAEVEDATARANATKPPSHYLADHQRQNEPWRRYVSGGYRREPPGAVLGHGLPSWWGK